MRHFAGFFAEDLDHASAGVRSEKIRRRQRDRQRHDQNEDRPRPNRAQPGRLFPQHGAGQVNRNRRREEKAVKPRRNRQPDAFLFLELVTPIQKFHS